jgi:hypothetical protein
MAGASKKEAVSAWPNSWKSTDTKMTPTQTNIWEKEFPPLNKNAIKQEKIQKAGK